MAMRPWIARASWGNRPWKTGLDAVRPGGWAARGRVRRQRRGQEGLAGRAVASARWRTGFARASPGEVQGEAAGLARDATGQGEEASPEGLGGCRRLAQTDARGPASEVVGHHLDGQPGGVGGEASRGKMVEPHAILEIADGILDLGVATMVSLEVQGVALRSVMKA